MPTFIELIFMLIYSREKEREMMRKVEKGKKGKDYGK